MDQESQSMEFPLAVPDESPAEALFVEAQGEIMQIQAVRARQLKERRRDFFRRWCFRGMDELRRQQAESHAPEIKGSLDQSL